MFFWKLVDTKWEMLGIYWCSLFFHLDWREKNRANRHWIMAESFISFFSFCFFLTSFSHFYGMGVPSAVSSEYSSFYDLLYVSSILKEGLSVIQLCVCVGAHACVCVFLPSLPRISNEASVIFQLPKKHFSFYIFKSFSSMKISWF